MIGKPRRAITTLMDATLRLLAADWACITDAEAVVLLSSPGAPPHATLPSGVPPRVVAGETAQSRLARAPLPGSQVLTVGRDEGPAFHRTELARLHRLLDVVAALPTSDRSELVPSR